VLRRLGREGRRHAARCFRHQAFAARARAGGPPDRAGAEERTVTMTPFLVDSAIKGVLILALGGAAALLLRRASAAARLLVWTVTFAGLCLLRSLAVIVPRWRAEVLPQAASAAVEASPAPNPAPSDRFKAEIDPARLTPGRGDAAAQTARATE